MDSFRTEGGLRVPAITAQQMREVDRVAVEEMGPNLHQMMENAGRSLASVCMMSSYGSDLAEARDALDLAIRGFEEGSVLAEASRYLVGLAVTAYCRTVLHSNVRGRLTDHVGIPDVHDRVKTYRNATVAHSQSELAVTSRSGSSTWTPSESEMSQGRRSSSHFRTGLSSSSMH